MICNPCWHCSTKTSRVCKCLGARMTRGASTSLTRHTRSVGINALTYNVDANYVYGDNDYAGMYCNLGKKNQVVSMPMRKLGVEPLVPGWWVLYGGLKISGGLRSTHEDGGKTGRSPPPPSCSLVIHVTCSRALTRYVGRSRAPTRLTCVS